MHFISYHCMFGTKIPRHAVLTGMIAPLDVSVKIFNFQGRRLCLYKSLSKKARTLGRTKTPGLGFVLSNIRCI